jgi:hypothetical protein
VFLNQRSLSSAFLHQTLLLRPIHSNFPGKLELSSMWVPVPRGRRKLRLQGGGLQATKPLQLSCYRAAGSGVQLSVRRVEDNCCIALIF